MRVKKAKRRPGAREFIAPSEPTNAAPRGNVLRTTLDEKAPFGAVRPPLGDLDRLAERKIDGGFSRKRKNVCGTCFEARAKNGSCGCRSTIGDREVRSMTAKIPKTNAALAGDC